MGGPLSEKKYLLQVHIDLEKVDGIVRIMDIHLREKDEIVKWDAELEALEERTDDEPPPPPPPFGLPPR